jgi:hypothetical protein
MTEPVSMPPSTSRSWSALSRFAPRPADQAEKTNPAQNRFTVDISFNRSLVRRNFTGAAGGRQNVLSRSQQIADFLFASDSLIEQDFFISVSLIDFAEQNDELRSSWIGWTTSKHKASLFSARPSPDCGALRCCGRSAKTPM